MNIYEFINSKDIRLHCEKSGHTFHSIESAYLIYQSQNHTLSEKHTAWWEVIETMPDMVIEKRINCPHYDSLHDFLKQYMALEDRILAEFFHEEADSVYRYDTLYAPEYYGDGQYHGYETGERLYQSFSLGLAVEKDEVSEYSEEFLGFAVTKMKVYSDPQKETREITIKTNECGAPLEITRSKNVISDEEDELFYSFEGVWIDVPTPFQKGDIVFTNHQKYGLPPDPFVLTKLCTDNATEQDQKTYKRLLKYGDSSDMTSYGYRLFRGGGEIRHECDHDYLSVEYYDRKLVGYGRVLNVIQAFFRDELDIGGCMMAYHYILLDEMARNREKYEGEHILQKINGGAFAGGGSR